MIINQSGRDKIMIVCERLEDGSRFVHYTDTSQEAIRLLKNTSPNHYRPLYLVKSKS